MIFEISVLKNFAIFTGIHLCWSLLNKGLPTSNNLTVLKWHYWLESQKQPFIDVLWNSRSKKFLKILKNIPTLECNFYWSYRPRPGLKIGLHCMSFSVNFTKSLGEVFIYSSIWLLLNHSENFEKRTPKLPL